MSLPSSRIAPLVGSISRSTLRATVDLPQPDSPTRPSVSPAPIEKLTPSTACTVPTRRAQQTPPRTGKCLLEVGDLEQRAAASASWRTPPLPAARQQAAQCVAGRVSLQRRTLRAAARRSRTRSAAQTRSPAAGWSAPAPCREFRRAARRLFAPIDPARHRGQQPVRVGMQRRRRTASSTVGLLDLLAGVHHDDALRGLGDDAEVVRDQDRSRCRASSAGRAIRSRICAWIVTSSAVVGSSAISSVGLQASAIAIITRWRMPPESWCGYSSRALLRLGNPDQPQHLDGLRRGPPAATDPGAAAAPRRSGRRSSSPG